MTRIDHAAEAREWIKDAPVEYKNGANHRADLCAKLAQAEATLALAEQQRIANLIALGQATHADGSRVDPWALTHP